MQRHPFSTQQASSRTASRSPLPCPRTSYDSSCHVQSAPIQVCTFFSSWIRRICKESRAVGQSHMIEHAVLNITLSSWASSDGSVGIIVRYGIIWNMEGLIGEIRLHKRAWFASMSRIRMCMMGPTPELIVFSKVTSLPKLPKGPQHSVVIQNTKCVAQHIVTCAQNTVSPVRT